MAKAKVHVLIPFTTKVACGSEGFSSNASYRHQVTCEKCKESPYYKDLILDHNLSKAKGMKGR